MKLATEKKFESLIIRDADFDNKNELKFLAKLYVSVPFSWDAQHFITDKDVDENLNWLMSNQNSLKCLVVLDQARIIGIHILFKLPTSKTCTIKTLWIEADYRRRGLGTELKALGEEWARTNGVEKIMTQVMSENLTMLEMNKRKGFLLTKFVMEKSL